MNLLFFYNKFKSDIILNKYFNNYEIIDDGFVELKNNNLKLYGKIIKINLEINKIFEIINKEQKIIKMETVAVNNIFKNKKYICYILL